MKYFDLFDDVTDAAQWCLGEITYPDGAEPDLSGGVRAERTEPLSALIVKDGTVPDFFRTAFAIPIATSKLAEAIVAVAGDDVQCVPVSIPDHPGMVVLNALRVIQCLDESHSEFLKWTKHDHRADLAGQYRSITKLVLDPDRIPRNAHFFRLDGYRVVLLVSEVMKEAMERAGCRGATFTEVSPRD